MQSGTIYINLNAQKHKMIMLKLRNFAIVEVINILFGT